MAMEEDGTREHGGHDGGASAGTGTDGAPRPSRHAWSMLGVQALALFVALLAEGLVTRGAALALMGVNFGMHAVLAAPLYALAVTVFFLRGGRAGAFAIAGGALGVFLGAMSPVMGASVLAPLACTCVAYALARGLASPTSSSASGMRAAAVAGGVFGGAVYPATMVAAVLLGTHVLVGKDALFCAVAIALAVAGALLGSVACAPSDSRSDGCDCSGGSAR